MPDELDVVKMEAKLIPMSSHVGYHHGDLANALLTAVDGIIAEEGLLGVSLREAARRAGVSHSAPAHHFGDKEGLLRAFAEQGFEMLADAMAGALVADRDRPLNEQLRTLGRTYLSFAMEHPSHYEVMFRAKATAEMVPGTSTLHAAAERTFFSLAVIVNQLGQEAVIDPEQGRYVATILWATCHGVASMWLDGILPHFYEDHTVDQLIDGVLETMGGLFFD
jgi:AcrR family transcriptional regulator